MEAELPDSLWLSVFHWLDAASVLAATGVTWRWRRIASDDLLWRHLFLRDFTLPPNTKLPAVSPGWLQEYRRLIDETPTRLRETLMAHKDEVLRAEFSNDGTMLATVSKDLTVKLWTVELPAVNVSLLYSIDLSQQEWSYPRYVQFNPSSSRLLVTGRSRAQVVVLELEDGPSHRQLLISPFGPALAICQWLDDEHIILSEMIPVSIHRIASQEFTARSCNGDVYPLFRMMVPTDLADRFLILSTLVPNFLTHADRTLVFASAVDGRANVHHMVACIGLRGLQDLGTQTPAASLDLGGAIIGMKLGADKRILAINIRPFPNEQWLFQPMFSEELEQPQVRLVDMESFTVLQTVFSGHLDAEGVGVFTFRYADINEHWVTSGSAKEGALVWSRHFGLRLAHLPHDNGVDCAVFHPFDQEMLVTVCDDHGVRIWVSKRKMRLYPKPIWEFHTQSNACFL